MNKYSVGIDVSKHDFHACSSGIDSHQQVKVIARRPLRTTKTVFHSLQHGLLPPLKTKAFPCSLLWKPPAYTLRTLPCFCSKAVLKSWWCCPIKAQYIADLKPAFIRWPGGCFVEGITIQSAPGWKRTIGPVEGRPGMYSAWGYWSSDGFGYHEYLQYCEDIGAAALYVFNAGVSCDYRSGTFASDDSLQPYIESALEAIEYAIGPVTSNTFLRAHIGSWINTNCVFEK